MKKLIARNLMGFFSLTLVLLLFACEKNDVLNDDEITGTYTGTLTSNLAGKTASKTNLIQPATVVVKSVGDRIEVHCFSEDFDETVMLNVYNNDNSVMVCLTGDDFENMYGHMLGQGHMGGGMIGDMQNNETEWMHHLNDEHQEGDEHFGNFDMQHHTFDYTFQMSDGDYHFQGTKK